MPGRVLVLIPLMAARPLLCVLTTQVQAPQILITGILEMVTEILLIPPGPEPTPITAGRV